MRDAYAERWTPIGARIGEKALAGFEDCLTIDPCDTPSKLFLERIAQFRVTAPCAARRDTEHGRLGSAAVWVIDASFLALDTRDDRIGLDGARWTIEGRRKDVHRCSPGGAIWRLGLAFFDLAGLAHIELLTTEYPRRTREAKPVRHRPPTKALRLSMIRSNTSKMCYKVTGDVE